MNHKPFSFRKFILFSICTVFLLLWITPAHAYYFGNWNIDGYVKSQFGIFTQDKPFNNSEYGGSDDNIATARQQMRWNLNGQITDNIGLRAEVLAAWEPDYPGEKNTSAGGQGHIPANYYSSFDWRELTIEYKPTYSHTIRFGRQIINWGEAISGRVVDQLNPTDSRYLLGFTNLEETYIPLWMFRGIHDFYNWNTNIEWVAAPIWRPDRYEHSRRMTVSGTRQGDGKTWGDPWYRFAANPEGRVEKYSGADMLVHMTPTGIGTPAGVYGPPFATGFHGTDLTGGDGSPMTAAEATSYMSSVAGIYPGAEAFTTAFLKDKNMIWTEFPATGGAVDGKYAPDYTDHNFKNTRWGFKTKHMVWGSELGFSFFQGPAHAGSFHYKYRAPLNPALLPYYQYYNYPIAYLVYEYKIPRYNTYGLFANYQNSFGMFVFEGAYKPDREYQKNLFGLPNGTTYAEGQTDAVHEARLGNVVERDMIHTLLGVTRQQNIPLLNKFNVFTIRAQWQAQWMLDDMDDLTQVTTYFMEPEQINHEFLLAISTSYSYRKYNPSLTFVANPQGQLYSSASFTVIPEGFNGDLSVSIGYTNIWGANDYSTPTVLAARNDLAVLTVKYAFY